MAEYIRSRSRINHTYAAMQTAYPVASALNIISSLYAIIKTQMRSKPIAADNPALLALFSPIHPNLA